MVVVFVMGLSWAGTPTGRGRAHEGRSPAMVVWRGAAGASW